MSRVKLSYKSIAKGTMKSIYLEYNPSVKDSRGKRVRYECLNLEIYSNPNTETQIEYNRTIEDIAERIRCERYIKLVQHDFSFLPKARLDEDFLEYFRINGNCHGAKYKSSRLHFEQFCDGKCSFKDINASLCDRFRLYLLRGNGLYHKNHRLSRNTASSYFNAFLGIVQFAYKDNILTEDFSTMVDRITWDHNIKKEYLTTSEIKQLSSTSYEECQELYRAGLFSIYTGLRRSDILALRWENIIFERGRKAYISFTMQKTGTHVQLPLSIQAVKILGSHKSREKVFPNLTATLITTHIDKWIRKAKINKHITFHCFRHTFAMQLLNKGIDIYTIAALLGHKQVASTQNYAKITPQRVLEAIFKMDK